MGVCTSVHYSIAIILMGKRELVALLNLFSWRLVMVERLFLTVPRGCLRFVIEVFPDYTHLLFFICLKYLNIYQWNVKMTIILTTFNVKLVSKYATARFTSINYQLTIPVFQVNLNCSDAMIYHMPYSPATIL